MGSQGERVGPAIELEAVLHTEQLIDVRQMLDVRLRAIGDEALWRVVTATNELVTNALVHGGRCVGLRAYLLGNRVRIEVDDPSPVRVSAHPVGRGLGIVAKLSTSWGDQLVPLPTERAGRGPRSVSRRKIVWCEIEL